jgi:hypothetical protein
MMKLTPSEWVGCWIAFGFCVVAMLIAAWTEDKRDTANDGPEVEIIRNVMHAETVDRCVGVGE